jgi:hypothetical protein
MDLLDPGRELITVYRELETLTADVKALAVLTAGTVDAFRLRHDVLRTRLDALIAIRQR